MNLVSEIPKELSIDMATMCEARLWALLNVHHHDKESRGEVMFAIRDSATDSLRSKYPNLDK